MHAILNLVSLPEAQQYLPLLREEIRTTFSRAEAWTSPEITAPGHMPVTEAFLRESMRYTPFFTRGQEHKVMKKRRSGSTRWNTCPIRDVSRLSRRGGGRRRPLLREPKQVRSLSVPRRGYRRENGEEVMDPKTQLPTHIPKRHIHRLWIWQACLVSRPFHRNTRSRVVLLIQSINNFIFPALGGSLLLGFSSLFWPILIFHYEFELASRTTEESCYRELHHPALYCKLESKTGCTHVN